ncbi:MAG: hypothetical protein AB1439_05125 [candidate division FCPU426 bacterium]
MKKHGAVWLLLAAAVWSGLAADAGAWAWKSCPDQNDVMAFLNGTGSYQTPIKEARICAYSKNNQKEFIVFYQHASSNLPKGKWQWKYASDPADVINLLNGSGAYKYPATEAEICALYYQNRPEFYVFYQQSASQQPKGTWQWKLANSADDVRNCLGAQGTYLLPARLARVAGYSVGTTETYYLFSQHNNINKPVSGWNYKLAYDDANDIQKFLGGEAPYAQAPKVAAVCCLPSGQQLKYCVFHYNGPSLILASPLANERFIAAEPKTFSAVVIAYHPVLPSQLTWTLDQGLSLGSGFILGYGQISVGTHTVKVSGLAEVATAAIRVYSDLWALYQAQPAQGEIDRVVKDFGLQWVDGASADEQWSTYPEFAFNQSSWDPSKIVAVARLEVLRHQRFSQTPPFTNNKSVYDHLKANVHNIYLTLNCQQNLGGGGHLTLNRNFSVWDSRSSGYDGHWDACKVPFANPSLAPYFGSLQLLVHEGRHCEAGDPKHVNCVPWSTPGGQVSTGMDQQFENGSGYAWGALYSMWVDQYGLYDNPASKSEAKTMAKDLLKGRFCTKPTHSNALVQSLINTYLQ